MPWSRPFDDPILLPGGGQLVTLKDAARHFQKLPADEQQAREWEIAAEILMDAAEDRDFLMHARIAMLRALNRNIERCSPIAKTRIGAGPKNDPSSAGTEAVISSGAS